MQFIAITGKARAGKDTAGAILATHLGWTTYALASPIKEAIDSLFGFDSRHRDGIFKEEEMFTGVFSETKLASTLESILLRLPEYRTALDSGLVADFTPAVFAFKVVFKDYLNYCQYDCYQYKISPRKAYQLFGTEWGRYLKDSIWIDIAPKKNVIWTDVRFDNEAKAVKDVGGIIIEIINPNQKIIADSGHASEGGIDDSMIDFIIENPMKKKPFKEDIIQALEEYMSDKTFGGL